MRQEVPTISPAIATIVTSPVPLGKIVAEPAETLLAALLGRMCSPPAISSPGFPTIGCGSRFPRADENVKSGKFPGLLESARLVRIALMPDKEVRHEANVNRNYVLPGGGYLEVSECELHVTKSEISFCQ